MSINSYVYAFGLTKPWRGAGRAECEGLELIATLQAGPSRLGVAGGLARAGFPSGVVRSFCECCDAGRTQDCQAGGAWGRPWGRGCRHSRGVEDGPEGAPWRGCSRQGPPGGRSASSRPHTHTIRAQPPPGRPGASLPRGPAGHRLHGCRPGHPRGRRGRRGPRPAQPPGTAAGPRRRRHSGKRCPGRRGKPSGGTALAVRSGRPQGPHGGIGVPGGL